MRVDEITLTGFRNYEHQQVAFSPSVNIITGENAQGKTNLLEAVSYLSSARSHRARTDRELIGWNREDAMIAANIHARERDFAVEARLRHGVRRRLTINGVTCKTGAGLSEVLRTVLFCPDDLSLVKDGAAARRRFLDTIISQLRPRYASALSEYTRLYEHKTRILRDWRDKPSLLATLDDFSERMCRVGSLILRHRAHLIARLSKSAADIHADFSGGRETLSLTYRTVKTVTNPLAAQDVLYGALLEHIQTHRSAELESRTCLSGIHKDDLHVEIDGRAARQFASQGQTRTAALSLKLAERQLQFDDAGEYPVLLLDDVLSELDARRQEFVRARITGGQVIITCCEQTGLELVGAQVFHVEQGCIL